MNKELMENMRLEGSEAQFRCPRCKSADIEEYDPQGAWEVDPDRIWITKECLNCKCQWEETYQYTHLTILELPEVKE